VQLKLLWLADFLRSAALLEAVITELILKRLDATSCLLFLKESLKKLEVCQESKEE